MQTLSLCDGKNSIQTLFDLHDEFKYTYDVVEAKQCMLKELFDIKDNQSIPKYTVWLSIWFVLKSDGIFRIHNLKPFGSRFLISKIFILINENNGVFTFKKVFDITPQITSPEDINDLMRKSQPLSRLFNLDPKKFICSIPFNKDIIELGSGAEGEVFVSPSWRSDVAIKRIQTRKRYIEGGTPKLFDKPRITSTGHTIYDTDKGFLETLSSSYLNDLTTSSSVNGYSLHVPRFTGFFICPDEQSAVNQLNDDPVYDIYIISELMQTTLRVWLRKEISMLKPNIKKIKAVIWQALYAIISLNELKWQHHDASPSNFLIRNVIEDELFLENNIYQAQAWTYKLNIEGQKSIWSIKNMRILVKISDFGFMTRFQDPQIHNTDSHKPSHRITNFMKKAVDVNYFLISLYFNFRKEKDKEYILETLYEDWFTLMRRNNPSLPEGIDDIMARFERFARNEPDPVMDNIFYDTLRSKEPYDSWNTSEILNSRFFADIII